MRISERLRIARLVLVGEGVRLDDPARIRLSGEDDERERVRDAVDGLADDALRLRAEAYRPPAPETRRFAIG